MAEVEALDKVWHPYRSRRTNAVNSTGGPFRIVAAASVAGADHPARHAVEAGVERGVA